MFKHKQFPLQMTDFSQEDSSDVSHHQQRSSSTTDDFICSSVAALLFSGMKTLSWGMVDWIFGVVGVKVHLGHTGNTSNGGTRGRIRGISVSTFNHFLFKVMESIKQESFQLFLKLISVNLHADLYWQQIP